MSSAKRSLIAMTQLLDLRNIDSADWELEEVTSHYRRWLLPLGDGKFIRKTEYLGDAELISQNKQEYDDSDGKRWGDGQVVARVPLNKLYGSQDQIMEKLREGDRDHLKWWLNSEAARPYRTFKGRI